MTERLIDAVAFADDRVAEALEAAAIAAGLGRPPPAPVTPVSAPPDDPKHFEHFLRAQAGRLDVDVENVVVAAHEVADALCRVGPALVELPGPRRRWLALVGVRRGRLLAVDDSQRIRKLAVAEVAAALTASARKSAGADAAATVAAAGLAGRRARRAEETLIRTRLADASVDGLWMIRTPPGLSFARQITRAGLWRRFGLLLAAQLAVVLLSLFAWWAVGLVSLSGGDQPGWLAAWLIALATLLPLRALVEWSQSELTLAFGTLLRRRLLAGALALDPDRTKADGVGRLLGRVLECDDIERASTVGAARVILAAVQLLPLPFALYAGAGGAWHVALLFGWLGATVATMTLLVRRRSAWSEERLRVTECTIDSLVGHRTRLGQLPPDRWHLAEDRALTRYVEASVRFDRLRVPARQLIPRGWLLLGIAALGPAVFDGASVTALAVSVGAVLLAYGAFDQLADGMGELAGAVDVWRRVAPIYQAAADVRDEHTAVAAGAPPGASSTAGAPLLQVDELSFGYPGRSQKVLRDLDLTISRGDRVLLLGTSGAGKSTLVSILAAQRRQDEGLVLLDRLDLHTVGAGPWRRRVALVPQFHENHVLSGTFIFNLLMARNWPPRRGDTAEARRVCEALGLDRVLAAMPAGLSQVVGDMGWNLSHGERSRLYIARALLQDPDVLILDESLAALDPELLERVGRAVLTRARTLVVIAHP